jgi:hypothetical protein
MVIDKVRELLASQLEMDVEKIEKVTTLLTIWRRFLSISSK